MKCEIKIILHDVTDCPGILSVRYLCYLILCKMKNTVYTAPAAVTHPSKMHKHVTLTNLTVQI